MLHSELYLNRESELLFLACLATNFGSPFPRLPVTSPSLINTVLATAVDPDPDAPLGASAPLPQKGLIGKWGAGAQGTTPMEEEKQRQDHP